MKQTRRILVLAITAIFAVSLLAASSQAQLDFGEHLTTDSVDVVPVLISTGIGSIGTPCFDDLENTATYDTGDSVYLTRDGGCGPLATNDVRLMEVGGEEAGSKVRSSHSDHGNDLDTIDQAELRFFDADGNGEFSPGDDAYWCLRDGTGTCADNSQVSSGWLRLTEAGGQAAGTIVRGGDSDQNQGTSLLDNTDIEFWDLDGDASFNRDDVLYLISSGNTGFPSVNDIRLGALDGTDGFGGVLDATSLETVATLIDDDVDNPAAPEGNLCYLDDDGDNSYDAGETIFFMADEDCTGDIGSNDLRLSGDDAGSKVSTGDSEHGTAVEGFAVGDDDAEFRFYDGDGTGFFGPDDTLYVCLERGTNTCGDNVRVGWLRLSGDEAGTFVGSGDSDLNLAVDDASEYAVGYWDLNGDGAFNSDDVLYIQVESSGSPEHPLVNMVRLGELDETAGFGTKLHSGSQDVVPEYTAETATPCYIDENGNGRYDSGEAIYLTIAGTCGDVLRNDVRLTETAGSDAGTLVSGGDSDFNQPYGSVGGGNNFATDWFFYDANGDNTFSEGDTAYLCIEDSCDAGDQVRVGWVRVTEGGGEAAGTTVRSGDSDINLGTEAHAATPDFRYWDVDADDSFNTDDVLYLRTDAAGDNPTVNHIRMAGSAAAAPGNGGTTDPTESPTEEPTNETEEPTTPENGESPTEETTTPDEGETTPDGEADEEATPFVGIVAVLAVLGAVLVALRRRS